jgi:two-component system LytT family sensor kinase
MTIALPTKRQLVYIYTGWWLLWLLLHTLVLFNLEFGWHLAFSDSLISNTLLALAVFAMTNALRFYRPGSKYLYLLAWSGCLALVCVLLFRYLAALLFSSDADYVLFVERSMPARFVFDLLMLTCMNLISLIWYNFRSQQESESRKTDTENLMREAELSKLRQQLQPHFLFNSLNSISALAGSRPDEARKMIQQLSDFLRGTLRKDDQQMVSLKEELQHLQLYLEIEKVRFGHRMNTVLKSSDDANTMILPSLLLQPVVENAIKFGLYDTVDDICIRITASASNHQLLIRVENPFDPATAVPRHGTGFGLSSVQRRLYLLYARNDLLHTEAKGNLFVTTILIPQPND